MAVSFFDCLREFRRIPTSLDIATFRLTDFVCALACELTPVADKLSFKNAAVSVSLAWTAHCAAATKFTLKRTTAESFMQGNHCLNAIHRCLAMANQLALNLNPQEASVTGKTTHDQKNDFPFMGKAPIRI